MSNDNTDPVYRWADDLEVGDLVHDEHWTPYWAEVTGIRTRDRSLADKILPKEFLFTARTGTPEDEGLFFFTHEFTYDDVLLTRTRRAL